MALLFLNLVFVGVFVAETDDLPGRLNARLWSLEVAIAGVFLVDYALRLYGATDRTRRRGHVTPTRDGRGCALHPT